MKTERASRPQAAAAPLLATLSARPSAPVLELPSALALGQRSIPQSALAWAGRQQLRRRVTS